MRKVEAAYSRFFLGATPLKAASTLAKPLPSHGKLAASLQWRPSRSFLACSRKAAPKKEQNRASVQGALVIHMIPPNH